MATAETTAPETGFAGVLVPVLTPFGNDLAPDASRLIALCRALLASGADGLAVFGTTSEANSMSAGERRDLLDRLLAADIPPARLMPGVGSCALPEAAACARHATSAGCGGVLMLPPWYYKNPTDDGLFAFYAETIERVGDNALRIYLYHFPAMSQVPLSFGLIERLLTAYPGIVVGIKDSGGDWNHTAGLLQRFPGFEVFCGSEDFLLETLRHGGRGCITATGNINVSAIKDLVLQWRGGADPSDLEDRQRRLSQVRAAFSPAPAIPLMKAFLALHTGDPTWTTVRPPSAPPTPLPPSASPPH